MERLQKSTGIILRRISLNEADQILTVLTEDQGKISLIAKGSQRLKSKFCGRLEPFYCVHLTYFQGRDLGQLNEAEILEVWPALEMNLKTKSILFFMAELTMKLLAEHQVCPEIYELLYETLGSFEESRSEMILYAYIVKVLTLLGFMGSWDTCSRTNVKINLSEPYYLCLEDASVVRSGFASSQDIRLTPSVIKWMNAMQKEDFSSLKRVAPSTGEKTEVWTIMQSIFRNVLNYPLKSEEFLLATN